MATLIIILGNRNTPDGKLFPAALSRADKAFEIWQKHKDYKILPTGGFGPHFNISSRPHGDYVKEYLMRKGVLQQDILDTVLSSTTIEDAILSNSLIGKVNAQDIIIVTSKSHMLRCWIIFRKIYNHPFHFVGAKDTTWRGYFLELRSILLILFGITKIPNKT